ncbi:aspartyl-tRNA synthetase [Perkinsela sp. CCAP 1560/4]|nr:aspartyl-tRNA synthetase [Perkinsela sp. CCAP 1560/4]|eukprot:KNH04497.1 aspartyl-tRNA synthetase [Perkinsela sp. CCAP 1560/4]
MNTTFSSIGKRFYFQRSIAKRSAGAALTSPAAHAPAPQEAPLRYGKLPLVQSSEYRTTAEIQIADLTRSAAGQKVVFRGRVSTVRVKGKKLAFVVVRFLNASIQVVYFANPEIGISAGMMDFIKRISPESIVEIEGLVSAATKPIEGTSQSDVEIEGRTMFVVTESLSVLPFQLSDASSRPTAAADDAAEQTSAVNQDTRLDNRWLDLRTGGSHAIFNLQSKMQQFFRDFLNGQRGFMEIHTPKLIGTASEGGANVFKVNYFGREAYLAQSPQLYKQMALQGDLGVGLFEIGPVFRAENTNTYRHLCEFMGVDLEMIIQSHYYEVLNLAEELFFAIFDRIYAECGALVSLFTKQYAHTPLVYAVPETAMRELGIGVIDAGILSTDAYGAVVRNTTTRSLRLRFADAVRLLNESKSYPEHVVDTEDLSTQVEKAIGRAVKARYGVDFYIIDEYPATARPFYTMPSPRDPMWSNSYDMFLRGEEISSGAQRIHDPKMLAESAKKFGVTGVDDYISAFTLGAWPHGGFGVGLERLVMLFLGVRNIRQASLFPRDPRRVSP